MARLLDLDPSQYDGITDEEAHNIGRMALGRVPAVLLVISLAVVAAGHKIGASERVGSWEGAYCPEAGCEEPILKSGAIYEGDDPTCPETLVYRSDLIKADSDLVDGSCKVEMDTRE